MDLFFSLKESVHDPVTILIQLLNEVRVVLVIKSKRQPLGPLHRQTTFLLVGYGGKTLVTEIVIMFNIIIIN